MPETEIDSEKKYIVQFAAFQEKARAMSSLKKYKNDGYDVFIYEKFVKNKKYFAVGIGPFENLLQAKNIQKKLKKNSISSFIYKKP